MYGIMCFNSDCGFILFEMAEGINSKVFGVDRKGFNKIWCCSRLKDYYPSLGFYRCQVCLHTTHILIHKRLEE
jgi:hypothetical protein